MAKILYVVHRYAPYPGGSEYNVQRYAEASLQLGHDVSVLALTHRGNYHGVTVTSDFSVLNQQWDLIVVHGSCPAQDVVLENSDGIRSPIMYLIIRPEYNKPVIEKGLKYCSYIGCATADDVVFVKQRGFENKIVDIKYPISCPTIALSKEDIKEKFEITKPTVWLSAGGFAPHKGMNELVDVFSKIDHVSTQLFLLGYDTNHGIPTFNVEGLSVWVVDDPIHLYELMSVADLYIWNSTPGSEGYGLVLLEAMYYGCPWIGREMAGGKDLAKLGFGKTYKTEDELTSILKNMSFSTSDVLLSATKFVKEHHHPLKVTEMLLSVLEHKNGPS